ncbi:T-lymphocyte surface antigen Ly-9-like [Mugil cephalus]|uniref:T-lymphocyte surface antigen Ly-9-like n=1 Tax=Mugil cephalus TaxID=48193 RepID=UPI001FB84F6B|nr:T-lymphocyte surface antigen Ly-9-like [Mugil cephalus]
MSLSVILGLMLCIEAPGSSAVTDVFVKRGDDVLLEVMDDAPKDFDLFVWTFNTSNVLVGYSSVGVQTVSEGYTGRVEFSVENYSVKLKNLQDDDSGVYTARVTGYKQQTIAEYMVTVQGPVSPVDLNPDSVSISSDSCKLTVTCSTEDSHISSTFTCDTKTCSQEGGDQSKVTNSGASLRVHLLNDTIICNHSNRVSWTQKKTQIQDLCLLHAGLSDGVSICLVKTVVFSVGLIIMVSVVISVHLMEKIRKQNKQFSSNQMNIELNLLQ